MDWFDWIIVLLPVTLVMWVGFRMGRYVRGVSDFLSAGRLCGRYVICMGDVANYLGIITLVTYLEIHYKTGFSVGFWWSVIAPLGILISLTGYCAYRFRQTRAMSLGQFLEMRYSRSVRICAAIMRSVAELVANMVMPAIAARFFIQLLGLPPSFGLFGFEISTFVALMLLFVTLSVSLICSGGLLSLIVADTIQMTIMFPLVACFIVFILCKFPVSREIMPVMADRVPGESFINPFDIAKLRDFNLFTTIIVPAWWMLAHRANWYGNGYTTAAKSPHEQKMAGVLGAWRTSSVAMLYLVLACAVITFMNHERYAAEANAVRRTLVERAAADVLKDDPASREAVGRAIAASEPHVHRIGIDPPLSQTANPDTAFLDIVHEALLTEARSACAAAAPPAHAAGREPESGGLVADSSVLPQEQARSAALVDAEGLANDRFQQIRTLFYQQNLSATMRRILPPGLFGLFALLLFLAMLSTDDTRIYSPTLTIAQDVVMPLRRKPFSPRGHMQMIRVVSVFIGAVFFFGSCYMKQLDYYQMFNTLAVAVWNGMGSPIMVLGLYTRFGTAAGAWAAIISSTVISTTYILVQRNWADIVYPAIAKANLVESFDRALRALSSPFAPWIEWKMDAVKCPVNTIEYVFFLEFATFLIYIVVSKLTCRKPFNLAQMLHREPLSEIKGAPTAQMKCGAARKMKGAPQMKCGAERQMKDGSQFPPQADTSSVGNADTLHFREADSSLRAKPAPSFRRCFVSAIQSIVGITPEYSRGDRIIAWAVFFYSFVFMFGVCFLGVVIWNLASPWPVKWWSRYFVATSFIVPAVVSAISTVWFGMGGILGLRQLFRDLKARKDIDETDDGRVGT